ncbi:DUF87 domain-containing protein [Nostoc sp. ATCC 53789]|uniref:helicase HerA domain-containing protein n=1 Tax=Nostoc sp. ATCC 53789 TaxID=76335 RepID=UPI000DECD168|nr:DUF87 domain-containing protein [Nostoc sp. ATCC 53789]QHG20544.1 DUF87 domain-containing protein [Nostoc sp. ATCC 53789]RCJ17989.1 AAA family ATPase [Nostoc sp. ATCC 53789]
MVKSSIRNQKIVPFEDFLDLATLVKLKKGSYQIGAYLLSKKQVSDTNNTLQLVFGYECTGFHPLFNSSERLEAIAKAFENGCKEFSEGEKFTFRWSSFCDEDKVIEDYRQRLASPVSLESEFLDWGQVARMQELTRNHQRKDIKLSIYTTFTVRPGGTEGGDAVDRAIVKLANFLQRKFTPTGATELTLQNLIQVLEKAIIVSLRHQQILSEMGLFPSPKSDKQLWGDLVDRMGAKAVKVPHTLVYDTGELREEINEATPNPSRYNDQLHATSVLLNNGIPHADRRWVCLPYQSTDKKKYIGVMTLAQKPEVFASTYQQIRFLWDVFSREVIYDVEIITEINPADQKMIRLTQQLITRRSINASASASKKTIDVGAQINTERSVDAQKQLYTGDVPENVAVIILVYRNSPEEIDDACRLISGYINQPAELIREMQYTWSIWLDTLLLRQRPQLTFPFNRRATFFASEVIGLTPVVQTAHGDKQGFELVADEGQSSVYIDLSKPKNMMVIGTTGSGKSVIIASIIYQCLALGMSVLMIDLPNDDGSGTFGDFTPYFNGFYFDISKESNNLVQPLDLSKIPESQWEERTKAHRNDINLIVLQLVLGTQKFDGLLSQTIESVIPLGTKAFYEDADIKERFELARKAGINTPEWANTPTLADMEKFFSLAYIYLGYQDDNVEKALNYIRLRLQYWQASSIGSAICKPSTFQADSQLITFALTNLQSGKDAEVFGMSAYIAASRQSLSSPNSVFFMDEASVLLGFSALSRLAGRKCATARKQGCRVFLAAQDVISIAKSEAGEQILQNMPLRLIGRIVPGAANSFSELLGIPREIIDKNESFVPNIQQLYTLWLLDYNNKYVRCRYYPSYPLLALVANSREEQATRDKFKKIHSDKFTWVAEFSKYYVECIKQGKPL